MNPERKRTLWYLPVLIGLGAMWLVLLSRADAELPYSEFKTKLAAGEIESVTVSPTLVQGRLVATAGAKTGAAFQSVRVDDPKLLEQLEAHGVKVRGEHESRAWPLIASVVPFVVVALLITFATRGLGKQGGLLTVGRSKAKLYVEKQVEVGFGDVVGVDEAKDELREVVEFLRTPDKFRRLGGQLPRGILLVGPPGTGKTLLARAVAGEAGVPFFSISGSEFVEMFVGVGAARVRDLFTQARERAPCIIFIDELDALGKARGLGPNSHDEREQTLNQLLVELDGFDPRAGVILMAATNRPEILDPALLRAGRFDRHVLLDRPDRSGRLAILQLHARKVTLGKDANLEVIASMTAGMVGADLANVINEAALLAVRRGKDAVGPSELQEAVERIIAGLEKRSRVLTPLEKERVAHHEIGHALLALTVPGLGAIQKISVIPRGIAALGYTLQLPTEDRFLMTQRELEDKIMVLLGGRIAEELSFGDPSTGAQDDLRKATDLARSMVRAFAMGRGLGHVSFDRQQRTLLGEPPGGSERGEQSEQVTDAIDAEVRRIVEEQYVRAKRTLSERRDLLRKAAELLLARETITGDELMKLAGAPAAQAA